MLRHRTTPRGISFLLLLAAVAASFGLARNAAGALPEAGEGAEAPVTTMLFPVLGAVQYIDDFGDPRGQGKHEGNDIVVARHSPVIAVEDGTVKWWTTSARAGCMLYFHAASGTTYLYIHLNNDRTLRNDNRGGCTASTTYTVPDGAEVRAGEQIAWSGDSGDADGNPHLHFELHPNDGDAVSPFAALNAATRTLFPARAGARAAVGLRGIARGATATSLDLEVTAVRWWPGGRWVEIPTRTVEVGIDADTRVDAALVGTLESLAGGATVAETAVTIFTRTAAVTPEAIAGAPLALSAARVRALA